MKVRGLQSQRRRRCSNLLRLSLEVVTATPTQGQFTGAPEARTEIKSQEEDGDDNKDDDNSGDGDGDGDIDDHADGDDGNGDGDDDDDDDDDDDEDERVYEVGTDGMDGAYPLELALTASPNLTEGNVRAARTRPRTTASREREFASARCATLTGLFIHDGEVPIPSLRRLSTRSHFHRHSINLPNEEPSPTRPQTWIRTLTSLAHPLTLPMTEIPSGASGTDTCMTKAEIMSSPTRSQRHKRGQDETAPPTASSGASTTSGSSGSTGYSDSRISVGITVDEPEHPKHNRVSSRRWCNCSRYTFSNGSSQQRVHIYLKFLRLLYYLFTTPFRLGLFYDPHNVVNNTWTVELTVFSGLDALVDGYGIMCFVADRFSGSRGHSKRQLQSSTNCESSTTTSSSTGPSTGVLTDIEQCSAHSTPLQSEHCDNAHQMPPPLNITIIPSSPATATTSTTAVGWDNQCSRPPDKSKAADLPNHHPVKSSWLRRKIQWRRLCDHAVDVAIYTPFEAVLMVINLLVCRTGCTISIYNLLPMVRLTKLPALIALPHLVRELLHRWSDLYAVQLIQQNVLTQLLVVLVLSGLVWAHWSASLYLLLARHISGFSLGRCATEPAASWACGDQLQNSTTSRQYVRAIYWATRTIVTLGFSDTLGSSDAETSFLIAMEFAGAFWCATVVSAWAYWFAVMKSAKREHEVFMHQVRKLLQVRESVQSLPNMRATLGLCPMGGTSSDGDDAVAMYSCDGMSRGEDNGRDIPRYLQELILTYLDHKWVTTGEFSATQFHELLQQEHLQHRLQRELKTAHVLQLPWLCKQSLGFVNALAQQMRFELVASLDWIIEHPATQHRFFVVVAGTIAIVAPDKHHQRVYTCVAGDAFGSIALFEPGVLREKAFAETMSELLLLSARKFDSVLARYYPDTVIAQQQRDEMHAISRVDYTDFVTRRCQRVIVEPAKMRAHKPYSEYSLSYWEIVRAGLAAKKAWQHPQSQFRRRWETVRCLALIYLAVEVPFIVIFHFGDNGLFSDPSRRFAITFTISVCVEIFFTADLIYRCLFFRPSATASPSGATSETMLPTSPPSSPHATSTRTSPSTTSSWVTQLAHLSKTYAATIGGSKHALWVDTLALLPLPLLVDIWDGVADLPRAWLAVSLLRLLRFLRVRCLHQQVRVVLHRFTGAEQFIVYCSLSILVYCHFVGCLWFLTGHFSSPSGYEPTTSTTPSAGGPIRTTNTSDTISTALVTERDLTHADCLHMAQQWGNCSWTVMDQLTTGADPQDMTRAYVRSLYFSISTFTTVAYGDILPYSTTETWMATWATFLGAFLCYAVVGAMGAAIARLAARRRRMLYEQHMLNRFVYKHAVSPALRHQLRRFQRFREQTLYQHTIETQLLATLSPGLRGTLCRCIHGRSVQQLAFVQTLFDGEHYASDGGGIADDTAAISALMISQFAAAVAARMTRRYYCNGDLVQYAGELATELLVIRTGRVRLVHPVSKHTEGSLKDGATLGEASFLSQFMTLALDVEALVMTEVSVLPHTALMAVGKHFPLVMQQLTAYLRSGAAQDARAAGATVFLIQEGRRDEPQHMLTHRRRRRQCDQPRGQLVAFAGDDDDDTSRAPGTRRDGSFSSVILHRDSRSLSSSGAPASKSAAVLSIGTPSSRRGARTRSAVERRHYLRLQQQLLLNGGFRVAWELAIAQIVIYNCFVIVARVAFTPSPSASLMTALTLLDWVLDVILLVDIYLKCRHFRPRSELSTVRLYSRAQIWTHYRRHGWFLVDVLASTPLYYVGPNFHLMTLCRLPRLIRALQLLEISELVQARLARFFASSASYSLLGLAKVLVVLLLCCHVGGSVFYALAASARDPRGWLAKDVVLLSQTPLMVDAEDVGDAPHAPLVVAYLRAFSWAMSSFTVINYGDVTATTLPETVWACVICLFGTFYMSNVGGEIVDILNAFDRTATEHRQHSERFRQLAERATTRTSSSSSFSSSSEGEVHHSPVSPTRPPSSALPGRLREKVARYLHWHYEVFEGLDPHSLSASLPTALRHRLLGELFAPALRRVPLLAPLTRSYTQLDSFAALWHLVLFLPDEVMLYEERAPDALFLLQTGRGEVTRQRGYAAPHVINGASAGIVLGHVFAGDLFGELAFFAENEQEEEEQGHDQAAPVARLASVRAVAYCEVLVLRKPVWRRFAAKLSNRSAAERIQRAVRRERVAMARRCENVLRNLAVDLNRSHPRSKLERMLTSQSQAHREDYSRSELVPSPATVASPITEHSTPADGALVVPNSSLPRRQSAGFSPSQDTSSSPLGRGRQWGSAPAVLSISILPTPNAPGLIRNHEAPPRHAHTSVQATATGTATMPTVTVSRNQTVALTTPVPLVSFSSCSSSSSRFVETSAFRYRWDGVKLAAILYYVVAIPLRVAFYNDPMTTVNATRLSPPWITLESAVDAFFVMDIYLRLFHFHPVVRGVPLLDRSRARRRYILQGDFYLDVLGSFPFEWLPLLLFPSTSTSTSTSASASNALLEQSLSWRALLPSLLRLEKLIRCFQIESLWLRLERYLFHERDHVADALALGQDTLVWLKMGFISVISSHWIACIWFYVGRASLRIYGVSWLSTPHMLLAAGLATAPRGDQENESSPHRVNHTAVEDTAALLAALEAVPVRTTYLRAYHYAIGSISTVTYGDICSRNLAETVVQLWLIFLCIIFYGYLTGGMRKLLARNLGRTIAFEQQLAQIRQFGIHHHLSSAFAVSICAQLRERWCHERGVDQRVALAPLSSHLRREVLIFLRRQLLDGADGSDRGTAIEEKTDHHTRKLTSEAMRTPTCHPFIGFAPFLVHAILAKLREEIYSRGDLIYEQASSGERMYFVECGIVTLSHVPLQSMGLATEAQPAVVIREKHPVEFFGEQSLLACRRSVARNDDERPGGGDSTTGDRVPLTLRRGCMRGETASAATKCHLAVLDADAFDHILTAFPEHTAVIRRAWSRPSYY